MPLLLPGCPHRLKNKKSKPKTLKGHVCVYICIYIYTYTHIHTCIHILEKTVKILACLSPLWKLKLPLNQSLLIRILRKVEIFEVEDQPIWPWSWNVFPT